MGIAENIIPFSVPESTSPPRKTRNKTRSSDKWFNSRAYTKELEGYDPYERAAILIDTYPDYPPDPFYDSGDKRKAWARHALEESLWVLKLQSRVPNLYFYTLHWQHLKKYGLTARHADPRNLFKPKTKAAWLKALAKTFGLSPLYWKLEVGEEGRIHIHVLADRDAGLPEIERDGEGEVIKRVYDLEGLLRYLGKPNAPFTVINYGAYLEAGEAGKRRHDLSGQLNLGKHAHKPSAELRPETHPSTSVNQLPESPRNHVVNWVNTEAKPLENPEGFTLKEKTVILSSSEQCVSTVSTGAPVLVTQIAQTVHAETNSERPAPARAPRRPRKPSYVRQFKNAWARLTYGPDANHTALTAREHIVIASIFKTFYPVHHPALAKYPDWLQTNWSAIKQLELGLHFDRHQKPPHALLALHFTMKYLPHLEKGNNLKIVFGKVYPAPQEPEQKVGPRAQAALDKLFDPCDL